MKKLAILTSSLMLTIVLAGCLLTFHPIYTPDDVVFDPALQGLYSNDNAKDGGPNMMEFRKLSSAGILLPPQIEKIKEKGYFVRFLERDGTVRNEHIVFMTTINSRRFIDFYPYVRKKKDAGVYAYLRVPMHAVYRIRTGDSKTLMLDRFNQEFLQDLIGKKQVRIHHESVDDKMIITASTSELQQYISKYGDRKEAYLEDPETYTKIKP